MSRSGPMTAMTPIIRSCQIWCPIAQVQASLQMIESAIPREASLGNEETSADIIVLDDITPLDTKAGAALKARDAALDVAL
jgi:hypothetical protein